MKTLKLDNPIKINGAEVTELTYDANEITGLLFGEADARRQLATASRVTNTRTGVVPTAELDYTFHLYLGYAAVVAVNPAISFEDLERAKGDDARQLMGIGRNFMLGKSEEPSTESNSDER